MQITFKYILQKLKWWVGKVFLKKNPVSEQHFNREKSIKHLPGRIMAVSSCFPVFPGWFLHPFLFRDGSSASWALPQACPPPEQVTIVTISWRVTWRVEAPFIHPEVFVFLLGQIRICCGFYTALVRKETSESPPPRACQRTGRELGGSWEGAPATRGGGQGGTVKFFFDLTPLRARVSLSKLPSERVSKEFIQNHFVPGFFSVC